MIEKRRLVPHIVTILPLKTCTTSTRLDSLGVSIIENDTTAGVLGKRAVSDDMPQVITKGAASV